MTEERVRYYGVTLEATRRVQYMKDTRGVALHDGHMVH